MTTTTETAPTRFIPRGSGNTNHPNSRPPRDLLSAALAKVCDEYDDVSRRLEAAQRELNDLSSPDVWGGLEAEAIANDARQAAEAARAGDNPPRGEALTALRVRRDDLTARVEALTEAQGLVRNDVSRAAAGDTEAGQRRLDSARAKLDKAAGALLKAVDEAAQAHAAVQWLNGRTFDRGVKLRPEAVLPDLAGQFALQSVDPVPASTLVDALRRVAG